MTSCASVNRNYEFKDEIKSLDLTDDVKKVVRDYKKYLGYESAVVLLTYKHSVNSTKNTYFVQRISDLSTIYYNHISFLSEIDNVPVLISSKNDGFINPENYSSEFISSLTKNYLVDDMLYQSIIKRENEGDYMYVPVYSITIDHSDIWKVSNDRIDKKWNRNLIKKEILIENQEFSIDKYARVVDGGRDDRTKKPSKSKD